MNTWVGCGIAPFDGDIALIGCEGYGMGKGGKLKFYKDQDIYLVIKVGTNITLGAGGVTLDDVKLLEEI